MVLDVLLSKLVAGGLMDESAAASARAAWEAGRPIDDTLAEFAQADEPANRIGKLVDPGVRNGNAFANAGRPKSLAFHHRIEDVACIEAGLFRQRASKGCQRLLPVLDRNRIEDDAFAKKAC